MLPKLNARFFLFLLVGAAGSVAGKWAAEQWVLKQDENDPKGFILMKPGFGLDEVVSNSMQFGAGYLLARAVLGKKT